VFSVGIDPEIIVFIIFIHSLKFGGDRNLLQKFPTSYKSFILGNLLTFFIFFDIQ